MNAPDLEKVQAARVWAVRNQPYLAIALHSLQICWVGGYGTFGVDRWWRLYVDPQRVEEWTVEEIGGVLLHEVWHLLREHHSYMQGLSTATRAWTSGCLDVMAGSLPAGSCSLAATAPRRSSLRASHLRKPWYPTPQSDC